MIAGILALVQSLLSAIPYFDKWFTKPLLEKEQDAEKKVEQEQSKNDDLKPGDPPRPSGDFWKDRPL